jgi:HEAT repeat protein
MKLAVLSTFVILINTSFGADPSSPRASENPPGMNAFQRAFWPDGYNAPAALPSEPGVKPPTCEGKTVAEWLVVLRGADPAARSKAAAALKSLWSISIPPLVELLKDENWRVRRDAAEILGKIGAQASIGQPLLQQLTKDKDREVRRAARAALQSVRPGPSPCLYALLRDENKQVSSNAAAALRNMYPKPEKAVPALVKLIECNNQWSPMAATWTLAELGPDAKAAVPALMDLLKDEHSFACYGAAHACVGIGPGAKAAVPALIKVLESKDGPGFEAAAALGRIGPEAKAAVPALKAALNDASGPLLQAAVALKEIGEADAAKTTLLGILKSNKKFVMTDAGFSSPGPPKETDCTSEGRHTAAAALVKLGDIADAKTTLAVLLKDKELSVRMRAAETLVEIGDAATAIPVLIEALQDKSPVVLAPWEAPQVAAARVVGTIGPEAKSAVPALVELLKVRNALTIPAAATALDKLGAGDKAIPELIDLIKEKDEAIRDVAVQAIGELHVEPKVVVAPLVALLRDKQASVRLAGALAIAEIGPAAKNDAEGPCFELAQESDATVREAATDALANIYRKTDSGGK